MLVFYKKSGSLIGRIASMSVFRVNLIYMDFKDVAKQLRKPEGEEGIQMSIKMNESNALLYDLVYSQMEVANKERILEIGFGNGKFIPAILSKAKDVAYAGIDFSATMVQEASLFNKDAINAGTIEIKEGSVSAIPYADESFDKIFTINTLYFWPDPVNDLKEIYRVLKKGGTLFLGIRPGTIMNKLPFVQHGFTMYEPEEVKALLERAGFLKASYKIQEEPALMIQGTAFKSEGICIVASR